MADLSRSPAEWLETDGLGGFASGTVGGIRTRRYHALLLSAVTPPTGRYALVAGVEAWLERASGRTALSTHRYLPDVLHPDGVDRLQGFAADLWPIWTWRLDDGVEVVHELVVEHGAPRVVLGWRLRPASEGDRLHVRPLLACRDYHALHHENGGFRFDADVDGEVVRWRPYADVPGVIARSNGSYSHEPLWYRGFLYAEERARGFDAVEDLAAPGTFSWDLGRSGEAILVFEADLASTTVPRSTGAASQARRIRRAERARRAGFDTALERSGDAYLAARGEGRTIIAGYPWFTDWGRDAFIALRGLCLATGRLEDARAILGAWAGSVSEGMLPNRFVDSGEEPEYNSVDASLWFVVAVHEVLAAARMAKVRLSREERSRLTAAVQSILAGYAEGTRYGIGADGDGLLAAGVPGVQLTWMDAKIGERVVTPRIGKPVEVQALWYNALRIGAAGDRRWRQLHNRARAAFRDRFVAPDGSLYDVVDVGGVPGAVDSTFRPNQVLAVGGLPFALLPRRAARRVVDAVEARLLTPLGLRSLAPDEPGYVPRYEGGPVERDEAYHQGTVWPWLMGPFVEAWVRVRGATAEVRREARERFLPPLLEHLDGTGLGHVSEIADAEPPHTPRGCPFQAWSVGELLRLDRIVLAEEGALELQGAA